MPYDENGEPVDIVLNRPGSAFKNECWPGFRNPLGVERRMGLAEKLIPCWKNRRTLLKVRSFLDEVYNRIGDSEVDLRSLSDKEILELATNLSGGVPVATPAFNGAVEEEVKEMLSLADMPTSGQIVLYDGRTRRSV